MKQLFLLGVVGVGWFFHPVAPAYSHPPEVQIAKEILEDVPRFRGIDTYRVDPYMRAAIRLQGLPKNERHKVLQEIAKGLRRDVRFVVLCRMLFVSKAKGEFRGPRIGGSNFLANTDYKDWPSDPIELVDGIPFLISFGYRGSGIPELPEAYLEYCVKNCEWSKYQFKPKTKQEKRKALDKLLASPKWKNELAAEEQEFLASQIE